MDLYEQFNRGIGMFSPLALPSEQRMARAIGPALAGGVAHMGSAATAAGANIFESLQRRRGLKESTQMKDIGDTLRQRMINDAQIRLREMMEKGQTGREAMSQAGQNRRTDVIVSGEMERLKKKGVIDQDLLDTLATMNWKRAGSAPATPAAVTDAIEEEFQKAARPSYDLGSYFDEGSGTW